MILTQNILGAKNDSKRGFLKLMKTNNNKSKKA